MISINAPQDREAGCEFGKNLRQLRLSKGLSVEEVSAATGIHAAVIEQWEEGKLVPSAAGVIKLSSVYGCSLQKVYKALLNTPEH